MLNDIKEVLLSEQEIDALTTKIAEQIDRDYPDRNRKLLLLCILKGSIVFMGDLMKKIKVPVEIDCMKVSSYGAETHSSGFIQVHLDLKRDIQDADVIVIEDIVDSATTPTPITNMQMACAADLFDWGVEVDETVIISNTPE